MIRPASTRRASNRAPGMTPEAFRSWRVDGMAVSQADAARILGYGKDQVQFYEAGVRRDGGPAPVPVAVAYACMATFLGLPRWTFDDLATDEATKNRLLRLREQVQKAMQDVGLSTEHPEKRVL